MTYDRSVKSPARRESKKRKQPKKPKPQTDVQPFEGTSRKLPKVPKTDGEM